jgi:hypothetical protein
LRPLPDPRFNRQPALNCVGLALRILGAGDFVFIEVCLFGNIFDREF